MNKYAVDTWCPLFSGFYNTIWDPSYTEESEFVWVNDKRAENGLPPLDDGRELEFDHDGYYNAFGKDFVGWIEDELNDFALFKFQGIHSPKYYNYSNDSIDVLVVPKRRAITKYVRANWEKFGEYVRDRYKSRSGFISSYPDDPEEFFKDSLGDSHKLGAVLDFIARNEGVKEENFDNQVTIYCKNFEELTKPAAETYMEL